MTLYVSYRQYMANDEWTIGDWLINYEGGFARRGLYGQFILEASKLTGYTPAFFAMCSHWFFYSIFFFFSTRLLLKEQNLFSTLLLLISPFIFTFQIHATLGGFRKEIIYLAALSYISFTVRSSLQGSDRNSKAFIIVAALYPLMILSHEMLAFFLPYIMALYFIYHGVDKARIIQAKLLVLPSVIAFVFAYLYQGGPEFVSAIKSSLGSQAPIKKGAIDWIGHDTHFGTNQVINAIQNHSYLPRYFWYSSLALIAFIPFRHRVAQVLSYKLPALLIFLSILSSIALSAVAIDWGRFLYLNLLSLFIVCLALEQSPKDLNITLGIEGLLEKPVALIFLGTLAGIAFLVLYGVGWYIPHCCEWSPYQSDLTRKLLTSLGLN
ncbi:hypothetical protein A9Q99_20170 [Gammaproteobacteria bacterium 45_16_T64]|nr:hypothetical protein A9Q99_20170 [Gammaproteobacteria bacterium 45_16_T64]